MSRVRGSTLMALLRADSANAGAPNETHATRRHSPTLSIACGRPRPSVAPICRRRLRLEPVRAAAVQRGQPSSHHVHTGPHVVGHSPAARPTLPLKFQKGCSERPLPASRGAERRVRRLRRPSNARRKTAAWRACRRWSAAAHAQTAAAVSSPRARRSRCEPASGRAESPGASSADSTQSTLLGPNRGGHLSLEAGAVHKQVGCGRHAQVHERVTQAVRPCAPPQRPDRPAPHSVCSQRPYAYSLFLTESACGGACLEMQRSGRR